MASNMTVTNACINRTWSGKQRLLVYTCMLLEGLCFWATPIYDPDLGFHLLGGAWVERYHDVPRSDFINAFNSSWVDYHWLGQLLIHYFYVALGWPGVQLFCGLVAAAFAVILIATIEHCQPRIHPIIALLLTSLLLRGLYGSFSARPTTLGVLIVAAAFLLLLKKRNRALVPLIILTVLCANIHIYWVIIPCLWTLFTIVPRFLRPHSRLSKSLRTTQTWLGLFALILAGSVSPYGIFNPEPGLDAKLQNYYVLIDVAYNPTLLKPFIFELNSGYSKLSWMLISCFLLTLIVVRRFPIIRILALTESSILYFGSFALYMTGLKYGPFFALFCIPLASAAVVKLNFRLSDHPKSSTFILFAAPAMLFILAVISNPFNRENAQSALKELYEVQPLRACTFIADKYQGQGPIRVGTYYDTGGWCAWALNRREMPSKFRVTMDGRTQFLSASFLIDEFQLYTLRGNWYKTLEKIRPNLLVIGKGQLLGEMLVRAMPEWKLAYRDESFAVFSRSDTQ